MSVNVKAIIENYERQVSEKHRMHMSFGINGLSIYWKDIPEESAFAIRDTIFKEMLKLKERIPNAKSES